MVMSNMSHEMLYIILTAWLFVIHSLKCVCLDALSGKRLTVCFEA